MARNWLKISWSIFIFLAILNLITVFMPEMSFDALWYHLPLSKLFLLRHQWYFPGGLYYYSAMPRLAEVMGMPLLVLFGSSGPRLISFVFGLIPCFVIHKLVYRFSKDALLSIISVNIYYCTWLVSWLSSSAYVDLVRTGFESIALYILVTGKSSGPKKILYGGLFLGLAVGVKWHALVGLFLYSVFFSSWLIIPALVVSTPWFLIAYHFTGNPIYPLFEEFMKKTQLAQVSADFYSPVEVLRRVIMSPIFLTRPSEDFLSPTIGIVFAISLISIVAGDWSIRKISLLGFFGTIVLLLTPPPSTRYYLPYLPAVIISFSYVISKLKLKARFIVVSILTTSFLLILLSRVVSFAKYVPFITGELDTNQFLTSMSHRLPDTFIDSDNFVKNNLPRGANYLISNSLHNLFYFPYDYDHESFQDKDKKYDYFISKNLKIEQVAGEHIHTNQIGIQIFKL